MENTKKLKFVLSRTICFYASHNLINRPIHIHKFDVTFKFFGWRHDFSTEHGQTMLINFFDIDKIWKEIIIRSIIDENKRIKINNSSCENIAEYIFDLAKLEFAEYNCELCSVVVFDGDVSVEVSL